jgi:hypothetical protein
VNDVLVQCLSDERPLFCDAQHPLFHTSSNGKRAALWRAVLNALNWSVKRPAQQDRKTPRHNTANATPELPKVDGQGSSSDGCDHSV